VPLLPPLLHARMGVLPFALASLGLLSEFPNLCYLWTMARETSFPLIQLSPRGQLTLPAEVRKALGLRAGDAFKVRIEEGEIVLEPVEITPIELYTDARVEEFQKNAELTDEELTRARQAWGL